MVYKCIMSEMAEELMQKLKKKKKCKNCMNLKALEEEQKYSVSQSSSTVSKCPSSSTI